MSVTSTGYPDVASREEWLAARKKLLAREREVTHLRDTINAERRRLPMVKVEQDYVFEGPDGELRLIDLFEGRPQLYIHHFMWIDATDEGCPSCTMAAELTFTEKDRALLYAKGVTFAEAVTLGMLFGPAQVGARFVERIFGERYHPIWTMVVSCGLMAAGLVLLLATFPILAVAIVIYVAGYGIMWIARGTLPLALFGPNRY